VPTLINGSPTHALIVHAVVVLLPLAVLAALVLVLVPSSRRAFTLASLAITFIGCLAIPLAFLSGGKLRARVPPSHLIDQHVAAAHLLLPVAAVFGLAFAAFAFADVASRAGYHESNRVEAALLARLTRRPVSLGRPLPAMVLRAASVVLVVMAVATAAAVVRVGDSGAKAVWHGRVSATPTH
jgi:hypothetical protein